MHKQKFFSLLFIVFCLGSFSLKAQTQTLSSQLTAHKWGLTSYVQVDGMALDTLFKTFDCEKEYVEFTKEYLFNDSNKKKSSRWELLESDSLILFKNKLGVAYKKSRIVRITDEELTLVDKNNGGIFFIENYRKCTGNDAITEDSRQSKEVTTSYNLNVGFQYLNQSYLETGFSFLKTDWTGKSIFGHVSLEASPSLNIYGISSTIHTQKTILYGGGLAVHTDGTNVQAGIQGVTGITAAPLGEWGKYVQLSVRLILPLTGQRVESVNSTAVTLRVALPVKKVKKVVRVIEE